MHVYDQQQKRFTPFLDGFAASVFTISPDRKWMVYADYPRHYLWRSKLDGSEKLQLTDSYAWVPQWSADSKRIVFSAATAFHGLRGRRRRGEAHSWRQQ